MGIESKFDHFNIDVTNLERSIAFYAKALGLKEHHRKESSDASFTLVYLTDGRPMSVPMTTVMICTPMGMMSESRAPYTIHAHTSRSRLSVPSG